MSEKTYVDMASLKAAKAKLRRLTDQAERDVRGQDMIHTAYKLGEFLNDALPDAWPLANSTPDFPDGTFRESAL